MSKTKVAPASKNANQSAKSSLATQLIPIHEILPDPNQPRQSFDEEDNMELAKSVAKQGILQPIMVRPITGHGISKYMVVFGHRRLWAAKYLRLESIPAQVKDLTDDEALHIQVIENLQRKNINPMEESDAFSRLVNKKIAKAEQLADELGVSTKYVYDRLALQTVIQPVQEKIRAGALSISHGKQFARLKKEDQEKLWENISDHEGWMSVYELKRILTDSFSLKLSDAPFSTSDAKLVPKAGACDKCQKRSGCNLLLFDDIQQDDICFDKDCYGKKTAAHIEQIIKDLEGQGQKVVKLSFGFGGNVPPDTVPYSQWDEVEEGKHHAMGVVGYCSAYSDYNVGQVIPVRLTELDNEEEETDTEADNEDGVSGMEVLTGKSESRRYIDHNNQIQAKVISALIDSFNSDPAFDKAAENIEPYLRKQLARAIGCLEEETAVRIAAELDIELSEDQKENWGSWKIGELVGSELPFPKLKRALLLAHLVEAAEVHYDEEELPKVEESLSKVGISAKEIVEAYTKETGYQL